MLFFLSVLVLVVSANAKFYTDCGSEHATVQKVSVSGCADDAEECVLKRGTNVTFSIDFTPKKEVTDVDTEVYGLSAEIPAMSLPPPDGCKETKSATCSLPAGQQTSQHLHLPIHRLSSIGKVEMIWKLLDLTDGDEENLFCVMISARIQ